MSRRVTLAMAMVLALTALAAPYLGIAVPLAWVVVGVLWLAVRLVLFESASVETLPVARWRLGSDIASPSLDTTPEDNLAWPVLALPSTSGGTREVAAPFGFYLYEFRSQGIVDDDLPESLAVRHRDTPFGPMIMPDDRSFALVGPVLFVAAMLLLWPMWASLRALLPFAAV